MSPGDLAYRRTAPYHVRTRLRLHLDEALDAHMTGKSPFLCFHYPIFGQEQPFASSTCYINLRAAHTHTHTHTRLQTPVPATPPHDETPISCTPSQSRSIRWTSSISCPCSVALKASQPLTTSPQRLRKRRLSLCHAPLTTASIPSLRSFPVVVAAAAAPPYIPRALPQQGSNLVSPQESWIAPRLYSYSRLVTWLQCYTSER
ncbi:hypothetical protein CCHR01_10818 [Colletotrichum chrysophilum]|uniref:Uncharacterized protein n=1 Tax=Colletotrichum chrysophilum TaxID=1836956 RepID=A0AAD9AGJ2_9PEZI|nr:hypothetical protein CCHR01_10818 [Colletotrichum chrysophilum]